MLGKGLAFQRTAGQRLWGALYALGAGGGREHPWQGPRGRTVEDKPRASVVWGRDQLLGEPWADNGLIKERVQAGGSWAWLQQEENVRN